MWQAYFSAAQLDEVTDILAKQGPRARIVAGGTDLLLELERGAHAGVETLVDVTRIAGLDEIHLDEDGVIHLGPMVTHNHVVNSKLLRERALPLAQAAWEVGSPQIRNRGTVAGNLITGSPANDTITPLMALDAWLTLKSARGERQVALKDFYTGVRKTVIQADEMLVDIAFRGLKNNERGIFLKLALRRAQAISVVNAALVLGFDADEHISRASITLGAVAPTIIHAVEAENFLVRKKLEARVIDEAAALTRQAASPIDDVRSSAAYRRHVVGVITRRGLESLIHNGQEARVPEEPVLLWGREKAEAANLFAGAHHATGQDIITTINGQVCRFTSGQNKTLLNLLRDEAGLMGTKEGCAEGECGACTVFLDGKAVMACLVPAPRAHGAQVITVEGLAQDGQLHPAQAAFVKDGAVQCGYCTPGFVMSAAKLLEEKPQPSRSEIEQALTGNLCRCTGYYKIIQAVENAAKITLEV